jgi:PAS domain S-box-containing protein
MRDKGKAEGELLGELRVLRSRIAELEQTNRELRGAVDSSRGLKKQLKDILDNTPVGVYQTTPDGRILMANPALVQMLGYSSFEELAVRNLEKDGYEPQYPRSMFKERIEKDGQVVGLESSWIRRDGTIATIVETAWAVRDKRRRTLYYEGIVQDLTEHKRAEDETRLLKRQLEFILGTTKTGLDIIDSQFNIRFIDPEWQKIYGDPTGKKCYKYFMGRNKVCPDCGIVKALRTKSVIVSEEVLVKENNRPIQVITIPFQDEKGEWLVAEVNVDITERKKAEEACHLSEEKFAKAFNSSPAAIFITTLKEGRFIDLNENAMRVFGYTREEVVGHTAKELNMWANYNDRDIVVQSIRRGNAVRDMEAHFHRKLGEVFDGIISVDIINIRGTECLISTIVDITERKKMEEGLKQYQLMVESAQDPMLFKDLKSRYIVANKTALQALGLPREQVIGKNDSEVLRNKDEARMAIEDNNVVFRTGKPRETVSQFTLADGRSHWFHIVKVPYFDDKGKVVGLVSIGRDVTKLKKTEDELREEKLRYQTLFESAPVGIGVSTPEGKVLECNDAMLKMLGYSETEVKQINLRDTYKDPQRRKELLKQLQRDGFIRDFEVQLKQKDGTAYYASLTIAPFTFNGQNVLLAVQENITERKQAQEMLNSYREKMMRAEQLASLGALGASLAHELAQPLTVATLSLENALTELKTMSSVGTVIEKLKDSLNEISNITSTVERFRNYARKSSEGICEEVNLKVVAERTTGLLSESARRARVTLHLKGLDRLPPVYLSEKDIEQVFFALVENAIQAADGRKDRQVIIDSAVKCEYVELRFSDNCRGIAPEKLGRIFEPFFTTKPIGESTGLGLCIVEHVVSRAGGKIRVESKAGKGTTFFVTLPINADEKL